MSIDLIQAGMGSCKLFYRHRLRFYPNPELLEDRCLLTAPIWPDWLQAQPEQPQIATLDAAQHLEFRSSPADASILAAGAEGRIVNQGLAGEVDWYRVNVLEASTVQLNLLNQANSTPLEGVISLFNDEPLDPFYPLEFSAAPFNPLQHRLIAQVETGEDGTTRLERRLAPGTYFIGVSGAGNEHFHPLLAGSGYAGDGGHYRLLVTADRLPIAVTNGPAVLRVDFGEASQSSGTPILQASPLAIWIQLSTPIDPGSVTLQQPVSDPSQPASTVRLTYNPTGQFGNGRDRSVPLAGFHYAAETMELQLKLAQPLAPGYYRLRLSGNAGNGSRPVIVDATGTLKLGQDPASPRGRDFATIFRVAGVEGRLGSLVGDDTPATANDLGDVMQGGKVRVMGSIGDDPIYDPALLFDTSDPTTALLANPAADVDLYRFRVTGEGRFTFAAEVFAGRLGSTLDAGLSLFRMDASETGRALRFVASNDNTRNQTISSDGESRPLYTDPLLDVGLEAGEYYLAVTSSENTPDGFHLPGMNGVFDPNFAHSGTAGGSTGRYVLNLLLQPATEAPRVTATSISGGATLTSPPTEFTVNFDRFVNVAALAVQAFDSSSESTVSGVFIVGPDGQRFFPRLLGYDETTNQATFLLLDRLPNGINELHLAGTAGLVGHGGIRLTGNSASGDHIVRFAVNDEDAPDDPLYRTELEPSGLDLPQDLGTLFPHEIQGGIVVSGSLAATGEGQDLDVDAYHIQVLAGNQFHFALLGLPESPDGLPTEESNARIGVTDFNGVPVIPLPFSDSRRLFADLPPGHYIVHVTRPSSDGSAPIPYDLHITLLNLPENPPPLSIGATPVLQIRFSSQTPPTGTVASPPIVIAPETPTTLPVVQTPTQPTNNTITTGGTLPVPPLVANLAPALRADLVGGVANGGSVTLVTASTPLQVQGLSNTTAAGNIPTATTTLLASLLVAPTGAVQDLPGASTTPPGESLQEWLSFWTWILQSLPQVILPSTSMLQDAEDPTEFFLESMETPADLPSEIDQREIGQESLASGLLVTSALGAFVLCDRSKRNHRPWLGPR